MDKEMQKLILSILKDRGFTNLEQTIIDDVKQIIFKVQTDIPTNQIIVHQAKMLRDEGKINFVDNQVGRYYEMTLKGKRTFDPWYKKALYWILYDKNNLYTILSVLISLSAIIISVIALNK